MVQPGDETTAAMSIECAVEKALSATEAHSTLAMVSLAAPVHAPVSRLPLEVVAVVDRSGSMAGPKLQTMKQTLGFLVTKGLQSGDSLSIVAFDSTVDVRLPLTTMDCSGKTKALDAVAKLQPGSTTNLSGGLLQGIDLLQSTPVPADGSTRAVLLFTDGIANNGITGSRELLDAARGAMAGSPMTLFTFGFGADHNENMLRSLAEATNGLYYYLEKEETIPAAFADCLGGLVAVVAQNATLVLTPVPGVAVAHVHASYQKTDGPDGAVELRLGDVYAEEEKDIVLQLSLPALPASAEEGALALSATLRYFSVPASRVESVSATLAVRRPALPPSDQPVHMKLEEQRLRVCAAEAMARAAQLADEGRLDEGRSLLSQTRQQAMMSPAAAGEQCMALLQDLQLVAESWVSRSEYQRKGAKMCKMSAMSHMQQRSNHISGSAYERGSKKASKAEWLGATEL